MALLPHIDIFFPNEHEAYLITGEAEPCKALQCFADAGAPAVALKLGARGAALLWHEKIMFADPYPVTPVDTTGAGDCFNAGFLHAWLKGEPPEICLRSGTICGGLSTEELGGIRGFPTAEQLAASLKGEACAK